MFAGALVNARSVAAAVAMELTAPDRAVTVIACGELPSAPPHRGQIRFALEDYLGAGAILSHLRHSMSPEAEVCRAAFLQARENLEEILLNCESGRELQARGAADDVRHAAGLDRYDIVPILRRRWF